MKKEVLGVKIDDLNMDQALEAVKVWLSKKGPASRGEKHYIVTPNPEIVVMAQEDRRLLQILNNADLAIPDGKGLRFSGDIVCNISGIDLMEALINEANDWGLTIGLLGGRDQVAEEVAERLEKKYKNLKIVFAKSGGEIDENGNMLTSYRIPAADLLFVAFGPPKQEKWVANNLQKIKVKVIMVVGGAFDVISGAVPRAPIWIRDLGLEWLFRLIIQPWRVKRQMALMKYLWLLTMSKESV